MSWLEYESSFSGEEMQKVHALRLASHLNLAMCHLKLQAFSAAIESCNKVRSLRGRNSTYRSCWVELVGCIGENPELQALSLEGANALMVGKGRYRH